jgi:hypothetical protein
MIFVVILSSVFAYPQETGEKTGFCFIGADDLADS